MEKRCTKCNRLLPLDCFVKDKSKSDGLYSSCKSCVSQCQKKEREQFPEYVKSRAKKFRDANIDRINSTRREQYSKNPEKAKQRSRDYRNKNIDIVRIKDRDKYQKKKEHYKKVHRQYYINNAQIVYAIGHRYRARKRNLPAIYSASDWKSICEYFDNKCAVCGNKRTLHADHWIPLASLECPGTVVWNIVPLCKSCNCSKKSSNALTWILERYDYDDGMAINARIESFLLSQKELVR